MENESFRERNRRRREQNAFENLYRYAQGHGISSPKRTAERAARSIHGGSSGSDESSDDGAAAERSVPHRLEDRTRDQLYERARDLDIAGRSQMTKDELVDAIREQR